MTDSFLSELELALVGETGRRINKDDRLLLARIEDAGRHWCDQGAVWLGRVSSGSTDAILICRNRAPELHFGDGRPKVTHQLGMFGGCNAEGGQPCIVEVTPLASITPGVRDIYIRSPTGCHLFFWDDASEPTKLGSLDCSDSLSKVIAERDSCLSEGGKLQPAFAKGRLLCTRPTRDAGKICTDRSQCESFCAGDPKAKYGEAAVGRCAAVKGPAVGCRTAVLDGKIHICGIAD